MRRVARSRNLELQTVTSCLAARRSKWLAEDDRLLQIWWQVNVSQLCSRFLKAHKLGLASPAPNQMSLETRAFEFIERFQGVGAQEIVKIDCHSNEPLLLPEHTCRTSVLIIQSSIGVIKPHL